MGMVVLHRHQRQALFSGEAGGIFARQVFRVQVAGNDFRRNAEKFLIKRDGMLCTEWPEIYRLKSKG